MAEEKKQEEGRKIGLRLKPVYTVDRDNRIGAALDNINMYLHKNGVQVACPFRVAMHRDGIVVLPCGEDCPHFHFVPETKKVPAAPSDGVVSEGKEEIIETGKIFVKLTCGCGGAGGSGIYYPIANVATGGKTEVPESKIIQLNK